MTRRWARGRLFDHAAAVMLYEPCVGQPTATVLKVLFSLQQKRACTFAAVYELFESCADSHQPLRSGSGAPLAEPLIALRSVHTKRCFKPCAH